MEINRQYIGARYVPKFYEGSNGTEWDENHIYDPLTIVTYLNNSYTSKKSVPASIGDPMHNPLYWAATGNYNAQVEAYRQEVLGLEDMIKDTFATPEMFGAVGDGVADDTDAVQQAFNEGAVYLNGKYKVTDSLVLQNDLVIYGENAEIDIYGDLHYPIDSEGYNIYINNVVFKKTDSARTNLNRCIFVNEANATIINCDFYNYSTAIHALHGDTLYCDNINIYEAEGVDAQYGYGIDSSAVYNHLSHIRGINSSATKGRHLIYLNGTTPKQADISHVYCKNWYHNPINITIHDTDITPIVTISDVVLDNVNVEPLGSNHENGAIHCSSENVAVVHVDNVHAINAHSSIISSQSATTGATYSNISVECVSDAVLVNQAVINIRNAINVCVHDVKIKRASGFIYAPNFRGCTNAILNNLYDFNDTLGVGINVRDSSIYIGDYITDATTAINPTGTFTLKAISRYST